MRNLNTCEPQLTLVSACDLSQCEEDIFLAAAVTPVMCGERLCFGAFRVLVVPSPLWSRWCANVCHDAVMSVVTFLPCERGQREAMVKTFLSALGGDDVPRRASGLQPTIGVGERAVQALVDMGFPRRRVEVALWNTGSASVEGAMEWVGEPSHTCGVDGLHGLAWEFVSDSSKAKPFPSGEVPHERWERVSVSCESGHVGCQTEALSEENCLGSMKH